MDYILTYHIKKSSSAWRHASRLRDNAFTRTLRRGRHPPPPAHRGDAELGSPDHSADHHDDDKALRREEFESNLLEMGLELERDEEVRVFVQSCFTGLLSAAGLFCLSAELSCFTSAQKTHCRSDYETQNSCVERTHLQLLVHAVCCCTIQAVVLNADWSVKQSSHANILLNSVVALNITRSLCTGSNYKQ